MAAQAGGWHTHTCRTPSEGLREAVLHRIPLALVDVGSIEDQATCADLVRMVRSRSEGLVVVCDQAANPNGELWARQEGAWVYLAGIDETNDITAICRQARRLTEAKQKKGRETLVG